MGKHKNNKAVENHAGIVDSIWNLLASPRFAVLLLAFIAATALVGAFLPQQPSQQQLLRLSARWGEGWVKFLNTLGFFNLYHSRWFRASLALLSISIFICSVDRLPLAIRLIRKRGSVLPGGDPERLRIHHGFDYTGDVEKAADAVRGWLRESKFRAEEETRGENRWFFINLGAYSRLGVYVVHASIITVIIGALIGNLFGFEGRLPVLEGQTADSFFLRGKVSGWAKLGFEIRCDRFSFSIDHRTGMTGNYESDLAILDSGKETARVKLRVNHPYHYRGIGFYQSSYELFRDEAGEVGIESADIEVFSSKGDELGKVALPGDGSPVEIPGGGKMRIVSAQADDDTQTISAVTVELDSGEGGKAVMRLAAGEKTVPSSGSYVVEIIARGKSDGSEVARVTLAEGEEKEIQDGVRIKLNAYFPVFPVHGKEQPAARILESTGDNTTQHMLFEAFPEFDKGNARGEWYYSIGKIERIGSETDYEGPSYALVKADPRYWTILDVNHDPGVPVVYAGSALLMLGLALSFFWSHRKVWIKVSPGRISMGGSANRNQARFEETFHKSALKVEELFSRTGNGGKPR